MKPVRKMIFEIHFSWRVNLMGWVLDRQCLEHSAAAFPESLLFHRFTNVTHVMIFDGL